MGVGNKWGMRKNGLRSGAPPPGPQRPAGPSQQGPALRRRPVSRRYKTGKGAEFQPPQHPRAPGQLPERLRHNPVGAGPLGIFERQFLVGSSGERRTAKEPADGAGSTAGSASTWVSGMAVGGKRRIQHLF